MPVWDRIVDTDLLQVPRVLGRDLLKVLLRICTGTMALNGHRYLLCWLQAGWRSPRDICPVPQVKPQHVQRGSSCLHLLSIEALCLAFNTGGEIGFSRGGLHQFHHLPGPSHPLFAPKYFPTPPFNLPLPSSQPVFHWNLFLQRGCSITKL